MKDDVAKHTRRKRAPADLESWEVDQQAVLHRFAGILENFDPNDPRQEKEHITVPKYLLYALLMIAKKAKRPRTGPSRASYRYDTTTHALRRVDRLSPRNQERKRKHEHRVAEREAVVARLRAEHPRLVKELGSKKKATERCVERAAEKLGLKKSTCRSFRFAGNKPHGRPRRRKAKRRT
jgi:hypothetical protein